MRMKAKIRQIIRKFGFDIVRFSPTLKQVELNRIDMAECFPPGHFYSVIPSLSEIISDYSASGLETNKIFDIDLNKEMQIQILNDFRKMKEDPPFYSSDRKIRFNIENDSFSYDDAPILHYMLRRLHPKRIIEIGSGYSSACMLDTSEMYLDASIDFTFIDPYCDSLRKNLLEKDYDKIQVIEQPIQAVDINIFASLQANDLLFIDSSHVIKAGSDLQTIIFKILPILEPGVWVHFHDIRYPFRYQKEWLLNKIFWNEAYFLQAFLMYNDSFEITFWLNYLINADLPEAKNLFSFLPFDDWDRRFHNCSKDFSGVGGSIYIRKHR